MFLFRMMLQLDAEQFPQVLHSLTRILEPTRALPGCARCQLWIPAEDETGLLLVEEWQTREHLAARLRDNSLRIILAAMDCAAEPPEVRFELVGEAKGLEFIAECRATA